VLAKFQELHVLRQDFPNQFRKFEDNLTTSSEEFISSLSALISPCAKNPNLVFFELEEFTLQDPENFAQKVISTLISLLAFSFFPTKDH
jgi:hypothetical protein